MHVLLPLLLWRFIDPSRAANSPNIIDSIMEIPKYERQLLDAHISLSTILFIRIILRLKLNLDLRISRRSNFVASVLFFCHLQPSDPLSLSC